MHAASSPPGSAGAAFARVLGTAALVALGGPALAEPRADASPVPIEITVEASRGGSLTQPSVERQRETLNQNAGSVAFVDTESPEIKNRYTNTLRDVLKDVPGVFVQNRYGQELRLSVRGSGIARGFHLRGIEILQDGIPVNLADGSGDFYQIDPLAIRSVEVFKGGNGLAYGSSTLGGAINFVTPTGYTAVAQNAVRVEAGSFGTLRTNAQMARVAGPFDFFVNGTVTHSDGYRQHETQDARQFNANFGYRLSPEVETRFYVGAYIVEQKLPNALPLADALHRPKLATLAAITGNQSRETWTERVANRTSIRLEIGQIDLDSWAIHKRLYHPIFQVIDQDGWTYGFAPRYTAALDVAGFRDDLIVGARAIGGNNEARQYLNVAGWRGQQTLNARQDAYNYEAYGENRFWFLPGMALMTGVKALHDERRYLDKGGLALDPLPKRDERTYEGANPKLGLLLEPRKDLQFFADATRSRDVPDFTDLTQTTAATTRFTPLHAQRAWTFEAGTRGREDRLAWDLTVYRSSLRDELLQFTTNPNIPASTFNAPKTRHQGIETGVSFELIRDLSGPGAGDTIKVGQVWTYSDFRFRDDAVYGDNRIAGIPRHVLRTTLTYARPDGFFLAPQIDWVPFGAFADYANTLRAPGYTLFGVQTGINWANGVSLFLDARNLTNRHYVSDISTITDARKVGTAVFYPGQGRSLFGGVRYVF
jgi:iron complex outermembrane receptor protein